MSEPIKVKVVPSITCPTCGAEEAYEDPTSPTGMRFNIRAFRVDDWSECLICKKEGREAWFQ
jgi:hypothetical protein